MLALDITISLPALSLHLLTQGFLGQGKPSSAQAAWPQGTGTQLQTMSWYRNHRGEVSPCSWQCQGEQEGSRSQHPPSTPPPPCLCIPPSTPACAISARADSQGKQVGQKVTAVSEENSLWAQPDEFGFLFPKKKRTQDSLFPRNRCSDTSEHTHIPTIKSLR